MSLIIVVSEHGETLINTACIVWAREAQGKRADVAIKMVDGTELVAYITMPQFLQVAAGTARWLDFTEPDEDEAEA